MRPLANSSSILVPKLCLGTRLRAKLRFEWKGVPQAGIGEQEKLTPVWTFRILPA